MSLLTFNVIPFQQQRKKSIVFAAMSSNKWILWEPLLALGVQGQQGGKTCKRVPKINTPGVEKKPFCTSMGVQKSSNVRFGRPSDPRPTQQGFTGLNLLGGQPCETCEENPNRHTQLLT